MPPTTKPNLDSPEISLTADLPHLGIKVAWGSEPCCSSLDGKHRIDSPMSRIFYPPELHDAVPDRILEDDQALRAILPSELVSKVESFPSFQWRLLVGLHRIPELCDMMADNPALAFSVANYDQFTSHSANEEFHYIRRFSRMPRKEVCKRFGFPGTPAMARIFQRITPAAAHPSSLRMLRFHLKEQPVLLDMLSHIPQINYGAITLCNLLEAQTLMSSKLLKEVAEDPVEAEHALTAGNMMDFANMRKHRKEALPPKPIVSQKRLLELHDEECRLYAAWLEGVKKLREERAAEIERKRKEKRRADTRTRQRQREETRLRAERKAKKKSKRFPPPPLPGNDHIKAICSQEDLEYEAVCQRNCVASLAYTVRNNNAYFYRVFSPKRATLKISLGRDKRTWRRDELKEAGNKAPSRNLIKAVDTWLMEAYIQQQGRGGFEDVRQERRV